MGKKESQKNKLDDFHKAQLENHRAIFVGVEPIITQDGKDQGEQNNIKGLLRDERVAGIIKK